MNKLGIHKSIRGMYQSILTRVRRFNDAIKDRDAGEYSQFRQFQA